MTRDQKTYLAWLNNAYAQELSMATMYEMHAKDASKGLNQFPELAKKLHEHAEKCRQWAGLMKECLAHHQASPNPFKIGFGQIMGVGLGFTGDVTIDKVIMNDLTDLGMANFEIGAYITVTAAAKAMKDEHTLKAGQQILAEKRAFAQWLEQQIPEVTQTFLERTIGQYV